MWRDQPQDLVYLINNKEWGYQKLNSAIHIGLEHNYRYKKRNRNYFIKSAFICFY